MRTPDGAIEYVAAAMKAAADIARKEAGLEISRDLVALTSFYQAHDLESWAQHMRKKKARGESTFVAVDPMALWIRSHRPYLALIPPKAADSGAGKED